MRKYKFEITKVAIKSYKGLTGHWTKYGKVYNPIDRQDAIVDQEWVCSSCGKTQPSELTRYKFEYPMGSYINICATCLNDGCIILFERIACEP